MKNDGTTLTYSGVVDELHARLNDAVAAVAGMASVLRVIATQSTEPEIQDLARDALQSPTVASLMAPHRDRPEK